MKPTNKPPRVLWIILTIGLMLLGGGLVYAVRWYRQRGKGNHTQSDLSNLVSETMEEYSPLTPYLIAQAKHESNNFQSDLYKRAKNWFGMKIPTKRPFTRSGESNGYSAYVSDKQALQDMLLYLRYVNFPKSVTNLSQYVDELKKRSFFEDSMENYYNGMKRFNQLLA